MDHEVPTRPPSVPGFAPAAERESGVLQRELAQLYGLRPLTVRAARSILTQALTNIIDTAIKYPPPGGAVTLRVRRDGAGAPRRLRLTVPVQDEGAPRVIEAFTSVGFGQGQLAYQGGFPEP